ncbi:hypothetical protein AQUCO_02300194v1 [Aquilegia coerulea]|uniref:Uncharacterized protein n=1 Tax=Aquilegia coerulea TaxID=218851 RepID=A0A2G5DCG2_AQUCA|nr:hypothetical protein AQUCO_02300194v1 [Aquilegia coerulea]
MWYTFLLRKMAKNYYSMEFLFISIFLHILLVKCHNIPMAPALYVFGDSLSDSGNNNFLRTVAKVNYKPYGIDFPFGATGRFTNGKTFVDFIAQSLRLPFPPPYLGLLAENKTKITTGVNYASGSAGILPETGTAMGDNLSFGKQIKYFHDTTLGLKIYKTHAEYSKHLSKSIFFISIGSNDYMANYLQPTMFKTSLIYTPHKFAAHLVDGLKQGLMKLYSLGARKFVVFNISRIGCIPATVYRANPKPSTPCVEEINKLVLLYNTRLPSAIKELEHILVGSTFVLGDAYNLNKTSFQAGFTSVQTPCCKVNANGICIPDSLPCPDSSKYLLYDAFHPTEVVNQASAKDCFYGCFSCKPINIKQLAEKR